MEGSIFLRQQSFFLVSALRPRPITIAVSYLLVKSNFTMNYADDFGGVCETLEHYYNFVL